MKLLLQSGGTFIDGSTLIHQEEWMPTSPSAFRQSGKLPTDPESVSKVDSVVLSRCNICNVMLIEGEADKIIPMSLCFLSCLCNVAQYR